MKLSASGVVVYTVNDSVQLAATISLAAGAHSLSVQAYNGAYYSASETITVSTATPKVTFSSPASNSVLASPVPVSAKFNGNASCMKLWVDGVQVYRLLYTSSFSTSVALATGQHRLTAQATSGGVTYSAVEYITVQ